MRATLAALLVATAADAAVVPAPGWLARTIPTPDPVRGGVVRRAGVMLVGQGAAGPGGEWVVRLGPGGATMVVGTGFNALGGFDLELDGSLLLVDAGGDLPGAVTGGTLFEVHDALTRTSSVAALGSEVLPPGTIPGARDVQGVPEFVYVSDAAGPGVGRVVRVTEDHQAFDLVTGLDAPAGLTFVPGGTVVVADGNAALRRYDFFGHPIGTTPGLSGASSVVVAGDATTLLVAGGVADDGSATVVAVAADGTVTERARGFVAPVDLFLDAERDELLVADAGVRAVTALCGDADRDGRCDADDPCTTTGTASAARLDGSSATVRFAGRAGVGGDFDPARDGLRVVVEGATRTLLDATAPADGRWRATAGGWRWRAPRRTGAGVRDVRLRRGGMLAFRVVATWDGAPEPADVPLTASLVLDPRAVRRTCAVAAPTCRFRRRGKVLRCG